MRITSEHDPHPRLLRSKQPIKRVIKTGMDLGFAPEMNSILHLRIPTQNSIHPENKTWILWNLGILEHLKICCFEVQAPD
jgi:hypothetical protein